MKPISSNILRAASQRSPDVRLEAISKDAVGMRDPQDREVELSFWESVRESDRLTGVAPVLASTLRASF